MLQIVIPGVEREEWDEQKDEFVYHTLTKPQRSQRLLVLMTVVLNIHRNCTFSAIQQLQHYW